MTISAGPAGRSSVGGSKGPEGAPSTVLRATGTTCARWSIPWRPGTLPTRTTSTPAGRGCPRLTNGHRICGVRDIQVQVIAGVIELGDVLQLQGPPGCLPTLQLSNAGAGWQDRIE